MSFQPPPRRPPAEAAPMSHVAHNCSAWLIATIGTNMRHLSTADRNRVLLILAEFIATQLEALESDTST
jgi:hypothetical protein